MTSTELLPPDFAALFEASPYPYLLIGTDYTLLAANRAYLSATGRSATDVVGRHIFEAFPSNPDDPASTNTQEVARSIEIAISTGKPHTSPLLRYAVPRDTPDGLGFVERYWSAVHTPVLDAAGRVMFVSQNAIDVTDLYRFDQSTHRYYLKEGANAVPDVGGLSRPQLHEAMTRILKVERDQLRELFDQAPGFIAILTGKDHVFDMANQAYYRLVGFRDLIGRPLLEALPEIAGQGFEELLNRVLETGEPVVLTDSQAFVQRAPDEELTEIRVDLVYPPLRDEDGRVVGVFALGNDVTASYKTKQALGEKLDELARTEAALKEADSRKDQFLAMLAHELRNPLAPIRAGADVLAMAPGDADRVAQVSGIIARQVTHMTGLVDDLIDVSRVTRGLVDLQMQVLDVKNVLAASLEQVRPLVEDRGHRLVVDLAPTDAHVTGDEKRLIQVCANLLNNAAKYTPDGGRISVRVTVEDDLVSIVVADDGVGMPPEVLDRAFELFAQGERTPDRAQGGLGIGLAVVKRLVELQGGSVQASSRGPGTGSEFAVRLPRTRSGGQQAARGTESVATNSEPLHVLIVDDNEDAARTLAMVVEALGHTAIVEYEGPKGLRRALAERPDACLLDIGLPSMDGNEIARRLRSNAETHTSTLIAVTGYGQDGDRRRAADAGFDHHLVKPVDPRALATLLARVPRVRRGAT